MTNKLHWDNFLLIIHHDLLPTTSTRRQRRSRLSPGLVEAQWLLVEGDEHQVDDDDDDDVEERLADSEYHLLAI